MKEIHKRRTKELQKGRSRKKRERDRRVLIYKGIIAVIAVLVIAGICWAVMVMPRGGREENIEVTEEIEGSVDELLTDMPAAEAEPDTQPSESLEESLPLDDVSEDVLREYENPGLSNASDYLNIRGQAEEGASVIGRLPANGVCEVLEEGEVWYHIRSGEVEGYVNGTYLLTGEGVRERVDQVLETQDSLETAVPVQE